MKTYYCAKTSVESAKVFSHITAFGGKLQSALSLFCDACKVEFGEAWLERVTDLKWNIVTDHGIIGTIERKLDA